MCKAPFFSDRSRPCPTIGVFLARSADDASHPIRLAARIQKYPIQSATAKKSRVYGQLHRRREIHLKKTDHALSISVILPYICTSVFSSPRLSYLGYRSQKGDSCISHTLPIHERLTMMRRARNKTAKAKFQESTMSSAPGLGIGRNLRACMVCSVILPAKVHASICPRAPTVEKSCLIPTSGLHRPGLPKLRRSRAVQRLSGCGQRLHVLKFQRRHRADRSQELVGGQVAAPGFVCTGPLCSSGSWPVAGGCSERVDGERDQVYP